MIDPTVKQPTSNTPSSQPENIRKECDRIVNRWGRMETDAVNWKTHWQECYEYIVPRKEDVIATRMPGDRRDSDLYDSTAVLANEKLASALHGMLTNPETKFFDIVFGDPVLADNEEVRNWCQDVGDRMFRVINNTNFQTEIYETYIDLGAIGTAVLYMAEHEENVVHFSARALKECRIDENALGLIDVVYRCFKWRAFQIVEEFGRENCSDDIIRAYEKDSQEQYEVLHAVEPMNRGEREDPKNKAKKHLFKSTYVLKDPKFRLSTGSFEEFPYAVPRWSKTTGEIYGRGPGMSTLPDIMMVNAMMLTVIQGAQMTVNPPLMVTDDGVIGNVRLTPGGLTVVRAGNTAPIAPLITNARVDFGEKMVEMVRERIKQGFYVDQMGLQQGPQMTAEEVKQRTEETLRLMGPILGRQHFEMLKPIINRLFRIMDRKKLLPPAPTVIQGKNFDVRYSSLIAKAQRVSEAQNIALALQIAQPIIQVIPSMADIYNADKIGTEIWKIYGNSHSLLRSQQELKKIREQRQAQAAAAAKQQAQLHQADVASKTAPMVAAASQANQAQQGQQ